MFCKNCGKQLADDARFCTGCGAVMDAGQPAQPQYAQSAPAKKQKKKAPVWLIIVAALAAFVIGKFAIAPSMMTSGDSGSSNSDGSGSQYSFEPAGTVSINEDYDSSYDDGSGSKYSAETTATEGSSISVSNSAFDEIFSSNYIVRADALFLGLDSAAFAKESDGMIDCMEFGYKDDMICEMVETIYVDISGMSSDEQALTDSQMRDAFSSWEACGFCEVSYHQGSSWYTVTITLHDLDQSSVVKTAAENGMLALSYDADWLSISATEEDLLAQGYVRK